jgi:hypothetical protein
MSTRRRNPLFITAGAVAAITWAGSALAADLAVKAPAPPDNSSSLFIVNDNAVSFIWAPSATDPGVDFNNHPAFNKYTGEFTHFDVWAYGTNFLLGDYIKSDRNNPVADHFGSTGATEFFALERSTLGFNQLTHSKMFSSFLFKNIEFEFGGNFNTNNDGVAPQLRAYMAGVQFDLNLPGTVNFSVLAYKEFNHNEYMGALAGVPFSGDREFHWAPRLELLVNEPLTFLPWPVAFSNTTAVTFPKGTGISEANLAALCAVNAAGGCAQANAASAFTKTEVRTESRLTLDASKLWFNKPGVWDMFVGYRYWYNKFGVDHNAVLFSQFTPGSAIESTALLGTTFHFK